MSVFRTIVVATAVAGTLDILAAVVVTLAYGGPIDGMLRYVASGPFPPATNWGAGGAVLGLAVHYALVAVMAAAFVAAARLFQAVRQSPFMWGAAYGAITYVAMNLVIVPLRFGTGFPPSVVSFSTQFAFHVLLVGIPIALIASRQLTPPRAPA